MLRIWAFMRGAPPGLRSGRAGPPGFRWRRGSSHGASRSRRGPGGPRRWSRRASRSPRSGRRSRRRRTRPGRGRRPTGRGAPAGPRSRHDRDQLPACCSSSRPPTTTTASTCSSSRSRDRWCSLVGRQTVSMKRTSACGLRASIDRRRIACDLALGRRRLADDPEPVVEGYGGRPSSRFDDVERDPGPRRSPGPRHAPGGRSPGRDTPAPGATGPPDGPATTSGQVVSIRALARRLQPLPLAVADAVGRDQDPVGRLGQRCRRLRPRRHGEPASPRAASRTTSLCTSSPVDRHARRGSPIRSMIFRRVAHAEAHPHHLRPDDPHVGLLSENSRADRLH